MTDSGTLRLLGPNPRNSWRVDADVANLVRPERPARPCTIASLPKPVQLDLARTALIVIDMQNDFCHPDGWLAGIGVDIAPARAAIAPIAAMLPPLRAADVPILWVNWGNRPDLANVSPSVMHVYDSTAEGGVSARPAARARRGCWKRDPGPPSSSKNSTSYRGTSASRSIG